MSAKTTIAIEESTKNKLTEFGKKGETYDTILKNILEKI